MSQSGIPLVHLPQRGECDLLRAFVQHVQNNPGKSFMVRRQDFDLGFICKGKNADGKSTGDIYIRAVSDAMTRHLMERTQSIIQEVNKANGNQSG